MKRILYITNVPSPYRVDYFNMLGRACELTVLFEGKTTSAARFPDVTGRIASFRPVFLSNGAMRENRVDPTVFRHLKKDAYDEIIATNYGFVTELAAILYLRLRRIPYWLELDGGVIRDGENPIKRMLKRTVIRGAQGIFTTGRATDAVMLHYGAEKDRLHHYPFSSFHADYVLPQPPTEDEKAALRKRLGIPQTHLILAIGQFIHRKGFDVLIDAAAHLIADTAVYIVGGAPTQAYQDQIAALGLTNVFFVDFMPPEALRQYYLAADVFALPTREDIWGLVINEAMACALPVVTTDRCVAGTELIQNGINGYLVPPEDAALLAKMLSEILNDSTLRKQMAVASLETIRGYTIERMAEAHLAVYGE